SFSWTADSKGVQGVLTSGSGNELPAQVLVNSSSLPVTVEYKVTVSTSTGGTCSGIPKTYRINVNPSITLSDQISDFNGFEISCAGANDGSITLSPSGGSGVF